MQNNREGYQVLATKVSNWAYERLNRLARKKGMSIYELVQMVCDTLLRYMDDRHNMTPEMERAMSIFEHMVGWDNAVNLTDHTQEHTIVEATYFVSAEGKKGTRAIHVERPFFDNWHQTENLQQILERTLELLAPERYGRLRRLAIDNDCSSLLELLDTMIDRYMREQDNEVLRSEFQDADRSEFGKKPAYIRYTKQQKADMDMFEAAERRRIEQESEEARQHLEDEMPFKPFGYEW